MIWSSKNGRWGYFGNYLVYTFEQAQESFSEAWVSSQSCILFFIYMFINVYQRRNLRPYPKMVIISRTQERWGDKGIGVMYRNTDLIHFNYILNYLSLIWIVSIYPSPQFQWSCIWAKTQLPPQQNPNFVAFKSLWRTNTPELHLCLHSSSLPIEFDKTFLGCGGRRPNVLLHTEVTCISNLERCDKCVPLVLWDRTVNNTVVYCQHHPSHVHE